MFVGNVAIGTQLTVHHLRNYYDTIVMVTAVILVSLVFYFKPVAMQAYGAKEDRKLSIPGEVCIAGNVGILLIFL